MKNIIYFSIILFLIMPSFTLQAQNIQSEIGFNIGTSLPSDDMEAKAGLAYQLDYRILNKNFGLQFSMNYLQNVMDDAYLMQLSGANSVNSENWRSVSGMLKMLGRINTFNKKLLFDISFGFGVMQSRFPSQNYNYAQNMPNDLKKISSQNDFSSAFVIGTGVRIHYKFNESSSVGLSYDLQSAMQNYRLKGTYNNGDIEEINSDISLIYSNFLIGVNYIF